MELDTQGVRLDCRGGLTLAPVNKVHHVQTIARVADMLGEDEDWLWDVANEMDQEDGLIWVYGPGDDGVMAFTDFGIETLTGLIEIYKADPGLLKVSVSRFACLTFMATGSDDLFDIPGVRRWTLIRTRSTRQCSLCST